MCSLTRSVTANNNNSDTPAHYYRRLSAAATVITQLTISSLPLTCHNNRRMFPPVRVTFSLGDQQQQQQTGSSQQQLQLNGKDKYQVLMDILPYDNKRYRYAYHKSSWQQAGKADPPSPTKLFLHPDGPFTLDQLKRQVISFEKIKLTNNDASKHGYVSLTLATLYLPTIYHTLFFSSTSQPI